MSKFCVVVGHPETGQVITQSRNNPLWGTVRLDQETTTFSNGILNTRKRTTFVRGEIANLRKMFHKNGQIVSGTIQRQTSETPFYTGQAPVANPQTGEAVINQNGNVFYQNYVFTDDVNAPSDVQLHVGVGKLATAKVEA